MKKFLCAVLVSSLTLLTACGKREEVGYQSFPDQQRNADNMNQQVAAIKSCMAEGLSEETCAGIHQQLVTGTLKGSPNMSSCEAQYGAGQCGSVPVAHADGSTGSVILPLVAGAALGYLAHHMMSTRSMPSGVSVPTPGWVNNRPSVYERAVTRYRQTDSIIGKDVKPSPVQSGNYAVKQGYTEKSFVVNNKQVASNSNTVPKPYVVPGSVKPTQETSKAPAKVEYKAPATGYAQQQKPAQTYSPPKVSYSSTSSASRSGGGKR